MIKKKKSNMLDPTRACCKMKSGLRMQQERADNSSNSGQQEPRKEIMEVKCLQQYLCSGQCITRQNK